MRKTTKLFSIILITAICVLSCGYSNKQKQILYYTNEQMADVAVAESKVIDGYNSLTGENYIDEWSIYDALNDYLLEDSYELIKLAEEIEPENDELREIHEQYIFAVNEMHQTFLLILNAIETQDFDAMTEANDRMISARKEMRDYTTALDSLMKEYKIKFLEITEE